MLLLIVQSLSHIWLFATLWTAVSQASLFFTISQSLFKLMSNATSQGCYWTIFYHPLLLLPSIFSSIRVFSNESAFHTSGQSTGVSASASVLPELISFRITGLISLLSKGLSSITNEKESIVWHSAFFTVQLFTSIHDYWKNHSFDYGPLSAKWWLWF